MSNTQTSVTPERILQFTFSFAPSLILEAALQHHIFDVLDKTPMTVEQVSAETGASVRGLQAMMNALVALEFLSKDEKQRYSLTLESSTFLVSTKPSFQGAILRHVSQYLLPPWLTLSESVQTGKPTRAVNQEAAGAAFFEEFVKDLFPLHYSAAQTLAEALNLAQNHQSVSVLDLAAGSGVWGIALAQASPQVQVTAIDWAGVIPTTQQAARQHGVHDQFRFVAGDLLDVDFDSGYQVAILGHILHSEGEARSRQLLSKVYEALAPGGIIAISEWLANRNHSGPVNAMIFAVNMLVNTDQGNAFSTDEIGTWLHEVGFIDVRSMAVPAPFPLLLATKPH